MPPRIRYLNTDLDLESPCDLAPLAGALESRGVFALNVQQGEDGQWYAVMEIDNPLEVDEPEATIVVMLNAIEAINGGAKELWAGCAKREFNIGYDCGDEPWAFNNGLTNSTLRRVARLGASLRITLYPPERTPAASDQPDPAPQP